GVFGDSQFTSTLSVNFHFPKIPRRTKYKGFIPAYSRLDSVLLNLIGRLAAFTFDIFENDEGL
ncbi:hypothetical protein ACK3ZM_18780, partial [Aeromonas caviae]